MPRFALLDAENRVVNVVALGRREDITHVLDHVRDDAGEIILSDDGSAVMKSVETDEHLVAHGAVDLVEVDASVKVGMMRGEHGFAWPPQPEPDQPQSAPDEPAVLAPPMAALPAPDAAQ